MLQCERKNINSSGDGMFVFRFGGGGREEHCSILVFTTLNDIYLSSVSTGHDMERSVPPFQRREKETKLVVAKKNRAFVI